MLIYCNEKYYVSCVKNYNSKLALSTPAHKKSTRKKCVAHKKQLFQFNF